MGMIVSMGALMTCSFGVAPAALVVIPAGPPVFGGPTMGATIMDFKPIANIPTFGMCNSPANPVVIAATAAKLGVFSPMPCVPATVAPWIPTAPQVMIGTFPVLEMSSKCMCTWGGVISITNPGQATVTT